MPHISINNLGIDYLISNGGKIPFLNKSRSFTALQGINLEVSDGERVGIIGRNGAGKSTLLKSIVGIYPPSHGQVVVDGSVVPLLELGAGFDRRRTIRENIYLNASILGLKRSEVKAIISEVLEFSGLERFADFTLDQLSSGMRSRLGFSIATSIHPEILILDEVFAAGDASFIERARERMNMMVDKCDIMLLVSHREALIQEMCSRAILIEGGRVLMDGNPETVIQYYNDEIVCKSQGNINKSNRVQLLRSENE